MPSEIGDFDAHRLASASLISASKSVAPRPAFSKWSENAALVLRFTLAERKLNCKPLVRADKGTCDIRAFWQREEKYGERSAQTRTHPGRGPARGVSVREGAHSDAAKDRADRSAVPDGTRSHPDRVLREPQGGTGMADAEEVVRGITPATTDRLHRALAQRQGLQTRAGGGRTEDQRLQSFWLLLRRF